LTWTVRLPFSQGRRLREVYTHLSGKVCAMCRAFIPPEDSWPPPDPEAVKDGVLALWHQSCRSTDRRSRRTSSCTPYRRSCNRRDPAILSAHSNCLGVGTRFTRCRSLPYSYCAMYGMNEFRIDSVLFCDKNNFSRRLLPIWVLAEGADYDAATAMWRSSPNHPDQELDGVLFSCSSMKLKIPRRSPSTSSESTANSSRYSSQSALEYVPFLPPSASPDAYRWAVSGICIHVHAMTQT